MLANVNIKGYNVYCCLVATSAALQSHLYLLLWSGSESTNVVIQIFYIIGVALMIQFSKFKTGMKPLDYHITTCFESAQHWYKDNF